MELKEIEGTLEECEKQVNKFLEIGHKARIVHMRAQWVEEGQLGSGTGFRPEKVIRWGVVVELR